MFTGIVEEIGRVKSINQNSLTVVCEKVLQDVKIGDSIALNGVCLTVTNYGKDFFEADISQETFNITTFKHIKPGALVNLERAMLANGRFGGHIVSGHIDGIAKIILMKKENEFYDLELELSEKDARYVVKKGSITVNGISLTVASINDKRVKIAIIPHTYENTNLKELKSGDFVNIEVDITAKYIEKFLSTRDNSSGISMNFLQENGFC